MARNRVSRPESINLRRFSRCSSSISLGLKKNVSSESEGRSDQPVGEGGEAVFGRSELQDAVGIDVRSRRASYLYEGGVNVQIKEREKPQ